MRKEFSYSPDLEGLVDSRPVNKSLREFHVLWNEDLATGNGSHLQLPREKFFSVFFQEQYEALSAPSHDSFFRPFAFTFAVLDFSPSPGSAMPVVENLRAGEV